MHLEGNALAWFHPIMENFLDNPADKHNTEMMEDFTNYTRFKKRIQDIYGDPDTNRTAF
jgi:hypothetical protein